MRILLVQPKMNKRPMDTDLKTRMAPSLALLTLMALTPAGHETLLANENIAPLDFHCPVDLVAVTVTLDVMPRACEIAKAFQQQGIPVVAGGIHITCCPEECEPHFNAICVGPGERVWPRMIADAAAGKLQRRYGDMADFEGHELASPQYGGIDQSQYLYTNVVSTSRGCPNRCGFCYNSCQNRLYVKRPIPAVIQDIRALHSRHVLFIDDNFIGDPAYTRTLLQAMKGMDLTWGAAVTTKILEHPELLDMMKETGCQSLFIGFESINRSSLASVNKDNRVEHYEKLVEAIHSRGIMINASMVFGLDGDTPDTFRQTLNWLVCMRMETLTCHILTPYPGTALYQQLEAEGRILDRDLAHYNTAHVVFQPLGMTAEELYRGYRWMYRQFYTFQNIARRFPQEKAQRKAYLLFNLLYRKFGGFTSVLARIMPMRILGKWGAWLSYKAS